MRRVLTDVVAMAAILSGAVGAMAVTGIVRGEDDARPHGAAIEAPRTLIRVRDVRPSVSLMLVRAGAPDRMVTRGSEIAVGNADFEALLAAPGRGRVTVQVEFVRRGAVVGRAQVTGSRPRVFWNRTGFGVKGS